MSHSLYGGNYRIKASENEERPSDDDENLDDSDRDQTYVPPLGGAAADAESEDDFVETRDVGDNREPTTSSRLPERNPDWSEVENLVLMQRLIEYGQVMRDRQSKKNKDIKDTRIKQLVGKHIKINVTFYGIKYCVKNICALKCMRSTLTGIIALHQLSSNL